MISKLIFKFYFFRGRISNINFLTFFKLNHAVCHWPSVFAKIREHLKNKIKSNIKCVKLGVS